MAETRKIPKDEFDAVIRALLKTPMSDIPRKLEPKAKAKRVSKAAAKRQ